MWACPASGVRAVGRLKEHWTESPEFRIRESNGNKNNRMPVCAQVFTVSARRKPLGHSPLKKEFSTVPVLQKGKLGLLRKVGEGRMYVTVPQPHRSAGAIRAQACLGQVHGFQPSGCLSLVCLKLWRGLSDLGQVTGPSCFLLEH